MHFLTTALSYDFFASPSGFVLWNFSRMPIRHVVSVTSRLSRLSDSGESDNLALEEGHGPWPLTHYEWNVNKR